MKLAILAAVAASSLYPATVRAQLLYHTGFETPQYTPGQTIDGVDGWFSFISPNAPAVLHDPREASNGRRALQCWGGSPALETTMGLLDGAWAQDLSLDPSHRHDSRVRVQCDVRLDGPDTGSGPNDDLVSANLYARNGVGATAFMFISSNGNVYCFANGIAGSFGYEFETPIVLGEYTRLAITLDYATHMAAFEVDGNQVGSLPFGGTATEGFRGVLLEFAAYDDPLLVDPSLYTGHWDNLSVLASPSQG